MLHLHCSPFFLKFSLVQQHPPAPQSAGPGGMAPAPLGLAGCRAHLILATPGFPDEGSSAAVQVPRAAIPRLLLPNQVRGQLFSALNLAQEDKQKLELKLNPCREQ